ncbi:Veg family protein [Alkalibacter rhizosphaerae]|uniref:Veg family protein n=1 Tax=Alkalibacter rhizosphaerae TaxID=2815577 RepID=A0A975AGU4_9FIRM|nr:Veg family protein [Alkalibacter rhizosphaerae]QSX07747.1 Veg family protein [Alkalibacter rhizosphaerae]
MNTRQTLNEIKEGLEHYVGHRVRLRANKSRKRVVIKEGVIEEIYPSIFVIKVEEANRNPRKMSFCYSDLLTHNIELFLCENNESIVCG